MHIHTIEQFSVVKPPTGIMYGTVIFISFSYTGVNNKPTIILIIEFL